MSKRKFLIAALAVLGFVPAVAGADNTAPAPQAYYLFHVRLQVCDGHGSAICQMPMPTTDTQDGMQKVMPYLQSPANVCGVSAIKSVDTALEGIQDRDDFKKARTEFASACGTPTPDMGMTLDTRLDVNVYNPQSHRVEPLAVTFTPTFLDPQKSVVAPLYLSKSHVKYPVFGFIPADSSCSTVQRMVDDLDIDSVAVLIENELSNAAQNCKKKSTAAMEAKDLAGIVAASQKKEGAPIAGTAGEAH